MFLPRYDLETFAEDNDTCPQTTSPQTVSVNYNAKCYGGIILNSLKKLRNQVDVSL